MLGKAVPIRDFARRDLAVPSTWSGDPQYPAFLACNDAAREPEWGGFRERFNAAARADFPFDMDLLQEANALYTRYHFMTAHGNEVERVKH